MLSILHMSTCADSLRETPEITSCDDFLWRKSLLGLEQEVGSEAQPLRAG
jgi:hypothetical protein